MAVPLMQAVRVGRYVVKQHMLGRKRYPLVLMLEPLFRCNLACSGCGKIDYPAQILNQRLSLQECLDADAEADAPVIAIAGGEPLLHKEMPEIVKGLTARKKYVYLCTNGLLLDKKLDDYEPIRSSPGISISTATRRCMIRQSVRKASTSVPLPLSVRRRSAASAFPSTAPCSTAPSPSAWHGSSMRSWRLALMAS